MKVLSLSLLSALLVTGGFMIAGDDGQCDAKCATECKACPVTEGMAKLPQLVYKVGDELACCENSAKSMAQSAGKPVNYVVGKESFECSTKAFSSLVEQTEKYVSTYATPKTCDVSGKTSVAGSELTCSVAAGEVAAKVKKAMDAVAISYKVGDKTCSCPAEAKSLAESSKAKTLYVVDGQETECEMTARLNVARAKYKAALMATAPAAATSASTSVEKSDTAKAKVN
ncbi:MAG: hypothetical protein MUC43_12455 [Pirellula sp.]|jgi:hypothetical protein|nr:hypothetical protein [Pirellula sp.]